MGAERTLTSLSRPREKGTRVAVVSLVVGIAAVAVVYVISPEKEGIFAAIRGVRLFYLAACLGLLAASWVVDALRLKFIAAGLGRTVNLAPAVRAVMVGNFLTLSTPFLAGGSPAVVYSLTTEGLKPGEAAAVVVWGGMVSQLSLALFNQAAFVIVRRMLGPGSLAVRLYGLFVLAYFVGIGGFFYVARGADRVWGRLRWSVEGEPTRGVRAVARRALEWLANTVIDFRESFSLLAVRSRGHLVLGFGSALLYFLLYFGIGVVALAGLDAGEYWPVLGAWLVLASTLALFTPTPGGSDAAELSAFHMLRGLLGGPAVVAFVILWRFYTFFLNLAVGAAALPLLLLRVVPGKGGSA